MFLGRRLKDLRQSRGWSMDEMGARVKLPGQAVQWIETGRETPCGTLMVKYAQAFEITLQYLIVGGVDRDECPVCGAQSNLSEWRKGRRSVRVCNQRACEDRAWDAGFEPPPAKDMWYIYLGDKMTDPKLKGMACDPVRRSDGKCVVSVKMATALVVDTNGTKYVVARRRLRLKSKLKERTEGRA